jgi:nitrite reductase (NO-forming)
VGAVSLIDYKKVKKMNNKKTFGRFIPSRVFIHIIQLLLVTTLVYADEASHHDNNHRVTTRPNFGPGDHYLHQMSVNLSDYRHLSDIRHKAEDIPHALFHRRPKTHHIKLNATEVIAPIAKEIPYHYWTFNNTVPGPMLRVIQGDKIELTLHNDSSSSHSHSIDLHAVTGPGGGAQITEVDPGETRTMLFTAKQPGLYIYHCASGNAPTHIANGMYGLILVEPKGGLPKVDKEFYIVQGEIYTHGEIGKKGFQAFSAKKMINEKPEYIVFNGRPGALTGTGTLTAKVGEKVRLFIGNAGVSKISSFHIIGEIFDKVYPEASTGTPLANVQTTLVPAGGASIIELTLDYPGNYALVDHALTRVDRGAWGILSVTGHKDDDLYQSLTAKKYQPNSTHH